MKLTTFGKEAGKPHYVYVGNQLMIDPTFYNQKTKEVLMKQMGDFKSKLHFKDFYVR